MSEIAGKELQRNKYDIFKKIDADKSGGITRREFQAAMPWTKKHYPFLAKYWKSMDTSGDGVLDWDEFKEAVHHPKMLNDLRRENAVCCYDVVREPIPNTQTGRYNTMKIFRNANDPVLKTEMGNEFDASIVYNAQRVEWEIVDIAGVCDNTPKGQFIRGRGFNFAGLRGCHLKFWPGGYRSDMMLSAFSKGNLPLTQGWCTVGLFAPVGTSLYIRFFVGSEYGDWQHVYFNQGVVPMQLWSPKGRTAPEWDGGRAYGDLDWESKRIDKIVIGCEVCENTRAPRVPETINLFGNAKGNGAYKILRNAKKKPKADERRQLFNKPKIDPPSEYLVKNYSTDLTLPIFRRIEMSPFVCSEFEERKANEVVEYSNLSGQYKNCRRREHILDKGNHIEDEFVYNNESEWKVDGFKDIENRGKKKGKVNLNLGNYGLARITKSPANCGEKE